MVIRIKIYNEKERAVKIKSCRIEKTQKILEENSSMIIENETTIKIATQFVEDM